MERIEIDYLACMFELCLEMLSSHYIEIACDRDFYLIFFCCRYYSGLCNENKIKCSINLNSRKKMMSFKLYMCVNVRCLHHNMRSTTSTILTLAVTKRLMLPRCYQYQIFSCHTRYVLKYTNVAVILRIKAHAVFACK